MQRGRNAPPAMVNASPPTVSSPSQKVRPLNATTVAISTADRPHAEYSRNRIGAPLTSVRPTFWLTAYPRNEASAERRYPSGRSM